MIKIQSFTFSPFQENTYLLSDDKGSAVVIDPGMYFTAEKERFEQEVLRAGFTIENIINTHCHIDHIFSVQWVHKKYNVDIAIHADEKYLLENGNDMAAKYGLTFEKYTGNISYFKEGDTIKIGEEEMVVIEAPGHSPGGVCFYNETQKVLIAGDVLFRESIGRTDLPGGNHEQLINNIKTKIYTLPDDVTVYSGHGATTTIGYEKRNNPFVQA